MGKLEFWGESLSDFKVLLFLLSYKPMKSGTLCDSFLFSLQGPRLYPEHSRNPGKALYTVTIQQQIANGQKGPMASYTTNFGGQRLRMTVGERGSSFQVTLTHQFSAFLSLITWRCLCLVEPSFSCFSQSITTAPPRVQPRLFPK